MNNKVFELKANIVDLFEQLNEMDPNEAEELVHFLYDGVNGEN